LSKIIVGGRYLSFFSDKISSIYLKKRDDISFNNIKYSKNHS